MWLTRLAQEHAESMNRAYINTIVFRAAVIICDFQDLGVNIILALWYIICSICMCRHSGWNMANWGKNSSNKRDKCFALSSGQLLCTAKLHESPAQPSRPLQNEFGYDWYVMVWIGMNTLATRIYLNTLEYAVEPSVLHTLSNCMA